MIAINVRADIAPLVAQLDALQAQQLPFALASALTFTALRVKDEEVREMRDVFDRPKPYTLGSLFTKGATKANLTANVGIIPQSPTERTLTAEIEGGERQEKPFEKALRAAGLMPSGYFAVPGAAANIDAYGNMSLKQINDVLRYFQAHKTGNLTSKRIAKLAKGTRSKQGFAYFIGAPGGGKLPLGIYQRTQFGRGSAIKPIIIFVPDTHYRKLFDFYLVGQRTIARDFAPQFMASLANALATARSQ